MKKNPTRQLLETDLYPPLRDYLKRQGYMVRAEVDYCDVVAMKDDVLIAVELKIRPSLELLYQATERQRRADGVYVAMPYDAMPSRKEARQGLRRILRQLELGLIWIAPGQWPPADVWIEFHPSSYQRRKNKKKRQAVIEEMRQRSGDYNKGGSTRVKIMTAYRESAFQIACRLKEGGPMSAKELCRAGTGVKTHSILYNNFYGWFARVDRGIYELTKQGREEVDGYIKNRIPVMSKTEDSDGTS